MTNDLRNREYASAARLSDSDYRTVFKTVAVLAAQPHPHNYARELYDKMEKFINNYTRRAVAPQLARAAANDSFWLTLLEEYRLYTVFGKWFESFFSYLDRFYTRRHNIPSVGMTTHIAFERVALSAALAAETTPRAYAVITLAFLRSRSRDNCGHRLYRINPCYELQTSLRELAGGIAPSWARLITGHDALCEFPNSARALAAAIPATRTGNPFVRWATRKFIADLAIDVDFFDRVATDACVFSDEGADVASCMNAVHKAMGHCLSPHATPADAMLSALTWPVEIMDGRADGPRARALKRLSVTLAHGRLSFCGLVSDGFPLERYVTLPYMHGGETGCTTPAAASCRPFQLLLLAAMVYRGADSISGAPLTFTVLLEDACEIIRSHLHRMYELPRQRCTTDGFRWHDS
jgi:hypothetical protein